MNDMTLIQFFAGLPILFFGVVFAGLLANMISRIIEKDKRIY